MDKIIAAVRSERKFEKAVNSKVSIIFDLSPDILELSSRIITAHKANKKLFIHMDLASGIGKDKSGIIYLKKLGVDGIISTRVNIIKTAREIGVITVQRFFIVDSQSLTSAIETVALSKPDIVEVMPGLAVKVLKKIHEKTNIPLIAGGLIENTEEVNEVLSSGAVSVSTGISELWNM